MSKTINPIVVSTDNFESWITKTNDVISALANTVTVAANSTGDSTTGNAFVTGIFGASTLATTTLRGGTVGTNTVLTVSSNTNIGNSTIEVTTLQNNVAHIKASSYTTTNTDAQILDSFTTTTYRSGKYLFTVKNTDTTEYQSTEIMILHDGTNAYTTEYATLVSGVTLAQFSANINSGTVRLWITPTTNNNIFKYHRTLLAV